MSDKALLNNLNKNIGGLGLDVFEIKVVYHEIIKLKSFIMLF